MATWTKLKSGEWGVRVEGKATAGQTVTVTKKSGETQTVTVGKVLWTGNGVSLCTVSGSSNEPTALDGSKAIRGQHWSQRGHGPAVRLCAGGCGRRVGPKYAECYSCHQESLDAM